MSDHINGDAWHMYNKPLSCRALWSIEDEDMRKGYSPLITKERWDTVFRRYTEKKKKGRVNWRFGVGIYFTPYNAIFLSRREEKKIHYTLNIFIEKRRKKILVIR